MDATTKSFDTTPWLRLLARYIDITLFAFVFGFMLALVYPAVVDIPDVILGLVIFFAWVFFESLFLCAFGATFGKWLFNIKVRDSEGKILDYRTALKRSIGVWVFGLGFGLPIVYLVTMFLAYTQLTKSGITKWDKDGNLVVSHAPLSLWRNALAGTIVILILLAEVWGNFS